MRDPERSPVKPILRQRMQLNNSSRSHVIERGKVWGPDYDGFKYNSYL